jgi:molybdopterin-guanine dinucleotide biosynthesis protein B
MALVTPFIFQIVGYQNSGKTTFLNQLLSHLTAQGIKAATIKHHGHGGKPAIADNKDSTRHITAGASASLVEGGGRLLLQVEDVEWTLKGKIKLISHINPDVILIEGHKFEKYPKAVFIRNEEDVQLLEELKNVELVLYENGAPDTGIVTYQRDDPNVLNWLANYILQQIQKKTDSTL